jgi:hypothetical protein
MKLFFPFLILLIISACKQPAADSKNTNTASSIEKRLFTALDSNATGINYRNVFYESDQINRLTYEYLYNGAGVAVGDINNDGLDDLYFSGTMTFNQLYLNKGDLKFENITQKAGVDGGIGAHSGVTMVDINADGWLDIYVCKSMLAQAEYRTHVLYINNKNGTFTDQAAAWGLNDVSYSTQAYFFDKDNDHDLDCYIVNHQPLIEDGNTVRAKDLGNGVLAYDPDTNTININDRLLENVGNRFIDASKISNLEKYDPANGLSALTVDINNDFTSDIFVANDFSAPDYLYINQKNITYKNQRNDYFNNISNSSMGSDWGDLNNDGYGDLICVDMLPEDPYRQKQLFVSGVNYDAQQISVRFFGINQYSRNCVKLNNGNGTFSEVGYLTDMAESDWSWAPLIADFDLDGYNEVFISNGYRHDVSDWDFKNYTQDSMQKLYLNKKISIKDYASAVPANKVSNYCFKNFGDLKFKNVSKEWGLDAPTFSNGAAYSDLDNDGDLDLIVSNLEDPISIYRNESSQKNYLKVKFKGIDNNIDAIGAIVKLYRNDAVQMQLMQPTKGFMSSNARYLTFGLGNDDNISKLEVIYPGGKSQTLSNIKPNQTLVLNEADATDNYSNKTTAKPLFVDVSDASGSAIVCKENDYIDFKREPLLPHMLSQEGPFMSQGDANGDGLNDVYVGGCKGQAGSLLLQNSNGKYTENKQAVFANDSVYEDGQSLFFDFDNDKDLDLYVVSGGNEWESGSAMYQDRMYINDGKANYTKATLPTETQSGSYVVALDYDGDSDLDLFVGGRVTPSDYPKSPISILLKNDAGKWIDDTQALPENGKLGMIKSAVWADVNGDTKNELIMAGEYTPIMVLNCENAKFTNTNNTSLIATNGWWNCLAAVDLDQDGDLDLVAGNRGLNSRVEASKAEPAEIFCADFDKNGESESILCFYQMGKSRPMYSRDQLIEVMPMLRKKLYRYKNYSGKSLYEIFEKQALDAALKLSVFTFESSVFINDGKGGFTQKPLPRMAQISTINALVTNDVNADGKPDIVAVGNDASPDITSGNLAASFGAVLINQGKGDFSFMPTRESGFLVPGYAKSIVQITTATKKTQWMIAKKNEKIQMLQSN